MFLTAVIGSDNFKLNNLSIEHNENIFDFF